MYQPELLTAPQNSAEWGADRFGRFVGSLENGGVIYRKLFRTL